LFSNACKISGNSVTTNSVVYATLNTVYSGRSRLRRQGHANNQHQSVTANYTELKNTLCGQGVQILNFTTDGTQAYHWDLNV
jgi:hypothetical protein